MSGHIIEISGTFRSASSVHVSSVESCVAGNGSVCVCVCICVSFCVIVFCVCIEGRRKKGEENEVVCERRRIVPS